MQHVIYGFSSLSAQLRSRCGLIRALSQLTNVGYSLRRYGLPALRAEATLHLMTGDIQNYMTRGKCPDSKQYGHLLLDLSVRTV